MTTFDAFRGYLSLEKKYSPHTTKAYLKDVWLFQQFNQTHFNQQQIDEVNYSQIRSWIVALVNSNNSNRSVNRKIASLKAYYKFLLKTKQIQAHPLAQHQSLKTPKKLQIPFSEKEMSQAIALQTDSDEFESFRNKLIIELLYSTGIRRAELISLKLEAVDCGNKTLKVLGKRNKERIIPILPTLLNQIEVYLVLRGKLDGIRENAFFFLTKKGIKISESFVYRLINSYFSTVSEKTKKSPHIIRHSFATHLLNNGADLNSVKELLGHSSLASTQIYTHNSLFELQKAHQKAHPRNKKE